MELQNLDAETHDPPAFLSTAAATADGVPSYLADGNLWVVRVGRNRTYVQTWGSIGLWRGPRVALHAVLQVRAQCSGRAGKRTTKRAPRPSSGSSSVTRPWWDSVTARTIESPRPLDPPWSLEPR